MAPTLSLQIEERDQAGSLVATYEHGAKQQNDKSDINITVKLVIHSLVTGTDDFLRCLRTVVVGRRRSSMHLCLLVIPKV